jgi:hypothetical protein
MGFIVAPIVALVGGASVGAALVTAAVGLVASITLSAIAGSIFRPKQPKFSDPFAGAQRTQTVREPITPWRVVYGQVRTGGAITFLHTTDSNSKLHLVITLAGHEVEEIGDIYFDDEVVPLDGAGEATGKYAGYVRVQKKLGTDGQTAFADLITEASDKWTADHRQRGRACIYVRLTHNSDLFASGIPNVTAIVKGKKVYDPRTSTTAWSANAALCLADYLTDPIRGLGVDYATRIDETDLIAAANVCDENVTLAAGGTEDRYTMNGTFDTSQRPRDIIASMTGAMAGRASLVGGTWSIFAGAYTAPTITLTEADLRGPIRVSSRLSRRDLANGVKGTFVSPDNKWQASDFPPVTSATYVSDDGGEKLWRDIDLPFTTSAATAQRIARIELRKARQQISVQLAAKLTAYRLVPGDVVGLTNTRMGWTAKPFEVTGLRFVADGDGSLGVDLDLRETASTIYDWTAGTDEEEVDPAPDTDLPNPFSVSAPTSLVLASGDAEILQLAEGSVISRIKATWTAPSDARVANYELAWKKSAETDWDSVLSSASVTVGYVAPVEDSTAYDVRVRSISGLGVVSGWVTVTGHVVEGKSAPPPRPDTFQVARIADGTRRFTWSLASLPADVRSGGGYRIRYKTSSTTDWSSMTALHEGLLISSPYETADLASGTYWFAIKTVDSSGNESTDARFISSAVLGDPPLRDVLLQRIEQSLTWPGTKTSCFLDRDNALHATSSQNWSNLPSAWSSLPATWDNILNNNSPIRYETPVLDLGADVNFTPLVTAVANGTVTLEMKTGTQADGTVTGSWVALALVEGKRYVQIRASVSDTTPVLSGLTTIISSSSYTDTYEDVNTATETASWFSSVAAGHFKIGARGQLAAISTARILALQNVGAGWSWELISKTQTVNSEPAAEFKVYNSSGTLANATIDVELRGPQA